MARPSPRQRWRHILTGLAVIAMAGPALAADPILERMAGDWIGHGFARTAADGTREPAYCKTTNTLAEDGKSLIQSGRCAVGPDSGNFSSTLTALGAGRYEGVSASPLVDDESSVRGTLKGGRLILVSHGTKDGEPVEGETTIEIRADGGYSTLTRRVDPETGERFEALQLIFTPAQ